MAKTPLFPVTTVGSWPRSTALIRALRAKQSGELSDRDFDAIADKEVIASLRAHRGVRGCRTGPEPGDAGPRGWSGRADRGVAFLPVLRRGFADLTPPMATR